MTANLRVYTINRLRDDDTGRKNQRRPYHLRLSHSLDRNMSRIQLGHTWHLEQRSPPVHNGTESTTGLWRYGRAAGGGSTLGGNPSVAGRPVLRTANGRRPRKRPVAGESARIRAVRQVKAARVAAARQSPLAWKISGGSLLRSEPPGGRFKHGSSWCGEEPKGLSLLPGARGRQSPRKRNVPTGTTRFFLVSGREWDDARRSTGVRE